MHAKSCKLKSFYLQRYVFLVSGIKHAEKLTVRMHVTTGKWVMLKYNCMQTW